jgi:hypothetical protein
MPDRPAILKALEREAIAVVLGVTVLALLLTPRNASALTSLVALAGAPLLIVCLRIRPASLPDASAGRALTVLGVCVAVLAVACVNAADPRVSYFGMLGQHSGGLMWLALALLASVIVVFARPGDAGRIARAVALTGAVLSASAVLDAVGVFRSARFSGAASGLLENSISLAQCLVVALGCAVAWALSARTAWSRTGAWSSLALVAGGIVLTSSRAAWVAVALSAAFGWGAVWAVRRWSLKPRVFAAFCASLVVVGLLGAWLVAGRPETGSDSWIAGLSNQRSTIWASAFAQTSQHLLFGKGPEQFSAWVAWSTTPGVDLSKTGTYDPHNLALSWLLAAGLAGFGALLAAVFAVARAVWSTIAERDYHRGLLAMAAGVGGLGTALMFAWTSPTSVLLATVATSAVVGTGARRSDVPAAVGRYGLLAVAIVTFALVALAGPTSWRVAVAEYEWARGVGAGTPVTSLEPVAIRTGDPTLATVAATARVDAAQSGAVAARSALAGAGDLTRVLERAAPWHVDAALALMDLWAARAAITGERDSRAFAAAVSAGKRADPASGMWDYIAAARAQAAGDSEAAEAHAEAALAYPQSEPVRAWLRGVAAGK